MDDDATSSSSGELPLHPEDSTSASEEQKPIKIESKSSIPNGASGKAPDLPAAAMQPNSNHGSDNESDSDSNIDPSEPLEGKNWDDLEVRYHQMVHEINDEEKALIDEFHNLLQFFDAWRQVSEVHEVDRTFKRLKTRVYHVKNSEESLEKKQQHYSQVVEAFKSALKLLEQ